MQTASIHSAHAVLLPVTRSMVLGFLLGTGCSASDGDSRNTDGTKSVDGGGEGGTGASADAGVTSTGAGNGGTGATSCGATSSNGGGVPMLTCGQLGGGCGSCLQEKCCQLAEICTIDADCACMAKCIGTASLSGTTGCLGTCGLTGSPPGFADLAICASTACANFGAGGECTVPAGFQPPPDIAPSGPISGTDIGSGALPDCSFGAPDPSGSILQLENADRSVCVRIERRNDGPGSLANLNWTLLSILVGPLGEVVFIDNPADICWYSSHHNFNDWAHAWSGSRRYEVKTSLLGHGATPSYTLHVFEQGPLAAGSCPPTSNGSCPIATMDLFPAR